MMKNKILALYLGFLPLLATAQNPIIQTKYTADPAPMVHNDTLFLYVGCDEKDAPSNAYLMREYSGMASFIGIYPHKTDSVRVHPSV